METVTDSIFLGSKIIVDGDCSHEIRRCSLGEKLWRMILPTKVHIVKAMVFQEVMYECASWTREKAERQRIGAELLNCGAREDSWESLGLQGDQTSQFQRKSILVIGRTGAEAPILWPVDANSQFIGKDPDAGKDWVQEGKGMIEDKMVGWHHWLSGHEFEQGPGDNERQGSLTCYSPWGHKDSDTT